MMTKWSTIQALPLLACLLAGSLVGQGPGRSGPSPPGGAPRRAGSGAPASMPDPLFTFRTRHFFSTGSDFEDRRGGYSLYGGEALLSITKRLPPRGSLGLSLGRGLHRFEFDDDTDLVAGDPDPFDRLHTSSLGLAYRHIFDRRWGAMGRARLQVRREEGADLADSLDLFVMAGARYQWTENFALSFGLVGFTRLEEDPLAFPAVMIDWDITPRLRLETARNVRLTCDLGEGWDLWTGLGFQGEYFRLDGDNAVPAGIVRVTRFPVRLGLGWSPGGPGLRLEAHLGWAFGQELTILDRRGRKLHQEEREDSLELGLRFSVSF